MLWSGGELILDTRVQRVKMITGELFNTLIHLVGVLITQKGAGIHLVTNMDIVYYR